MLPKDEVVEAAFSPEESYRANVLQRFNFKLNYS